MITRLNKSSLRLSAYLCVLCVKRVFQRRGRGDTQRAAEKLIHPRARSVADPDPFPPDVKPRV